MLDLIRNWISNDGLASNNGELVVRNVNNRELIVKNEGVSQELEDNISKTFYNLEDISTSFEESFPNYDPNEPLFPVKIVKNVYGYFKELNSEIKSEIGNKVIKILEVYQGMSDYKPLGRFGDYTINESIMYAANFNYEFIVNNMKVAINPLKIISAGLIYKTVVNCYARTIYPMSELKYKKNELEKLMWLKIRNTKITLFMLVYAPLITFSLFHGCNSSILDTIQLKIRQTNLDINEVEKSIFSLLFSIKNYKLNNKGNKFNNNIKYFSSDTNNENNNNNKNKFNWIINFLIFLFFFVYFVDLKTLIIIIKNITYSKVVFVTIIIGSMVMIYQIIELYILILFIKNKIEISNYLPTFLFNWLNKQKSISKYSPEGVRAFMDLYVRTIISHIIILSFFIFIYNYFL